MIHMYIGAEIHQNTKTACKIPLENLPRAHASVPYKARQYVTCETCAAIAAKTANMRGES